MKALMAIFLGLIQGLAEFLPISSSGHLSIIQNLFGMKYAEEEHLLFDVLLHLGTLTAVFLVYWNEIREIASDTFSFLAGRETAKGDDGRLKPTIRSVILIIVATLPLILILPFKDKIELLYYNTPFISFALIITGILLYVSGKLAEGRKSEKTSTLADALIVGLAQAIAVIPGLSRSGTTITVGMSRGFKKEFAARFSFLLSIPAIVGSVLITLISAIKKGVVWANGPAYLLGMLVAGVSGYFALKLVKKLLSSDNFSKFAYYCWGVGILSLILSIFI